MYDGEWKFGSFIKGKLFTEVKNFNCKGIEFLPQTKIF